MGFSRQEYWSGLPFPPPGDLHDPGIKPAALASPALAGRFLTTSATWEAKDAPRHCQMSLYWGSCFILWALLPHELHWWREPAIASRAWSWKWTWISLDPAGSQGAVGLLRTEHSGISPGLGRKNNLASLSDLERLLYALTLCEMWFSQSTPLQSDTWNRPLKNTHCYSADSWDFQKEAMGLDFSPPRVWLNTEALEWDQP